MSIEVYPARTKVYCPMLQKEIVDSYCVQCDNYNGHKINAVARAFYIECMHERGIGEVRIAEKKIDHESIKKWDQVFEEHSDQIKDILANLKSFNPFKPIEPNNVQT